MLARLMRRNEHQQQEQQQGQEKNKMKSKNKYLLACFPFAGIKFPVTYEVKLEMFNKVFDFKKLRLNSSFQDLKDPDKKTKFAFSNLIRTDSCAADILGFNGSLTAKNRFYLYQGVQRARAEMTNILVDGGRKYNKSKRKNTKKSRKRRRKRRKNKEAVRNDSNKQSIQESAKTNRYWKPEKFNQDKNKPPIISFGNGMFGKDSVKIKGLRAGVTGVFWRQLKFRQRSGDLLLVYVARMG
ncbi:hypothetical protein K7432_007851 [Basidiobolus ranarum]|uniref:Uncharacterized protein n=1 Tax=Basidiobolus ranarum TaxID=34480 RepID=A0ABR2WSY9_9FUNG